MAERPPLAVLLGPTASGKTRLALDLAATNGTDIISADSVQVYVGLDIGSAKPTRDERLRVRHHGLDVLTPSEPSHAGRWLAAVEPAIAALHSRGQIPLVVGGTGMYARALLLGLSAIPEITAEVRDAVRALVTHDAPAAHAELSRLDPMTAARLAVNDAQRIGRALEVARQTGRALSAWHADDPPTPRFDARIVVLDPEPALLEARLAERAGRMLADGLVAEVQALLAAGVAPDAPGLMTLGYREVVHALSRGQDVAVAALTRAHRQYAKRQRTWFRGSGMAGAGALHTLDPDAPDAASRLAALLKG